MTETPSNVTVAFDLECDEVKFDSKKMQQMIKTVCCRFSTGAVAVNVIIVGDGRISELTSKFLNRMTTTDVLSFDLSEKQDAVPNYFMVRLWLQEKTLQIF